MSTKFNLIRDISGYNGFGIIPTWDVESAVLAVGVEQHITVPSNYPNWIAIFSYTPGASVWVSFSTTAIAPTGAFSATHSVLNPSARAVSAGEVLSFITADSTNPMVCVELQIVAPYQN
jgi:hypothetical protein